MLNRIIVIGRLTKDPELRYTPNGVPVATFSVACDRPVRPGGERETDFFDIVTWRKLAETVGNHLRKGRLVALQGRLQIRSYEAQDGTRRKVTEIVADDVQFLDRPTAGEEGPDDEPGDLGEELPF